MNVTLPAEWEKQLATIVAMPHKDSDWKPYLTQAQNKMIEIILHIARFQYVIVLYKYKQDIISLQKKTNVHLVNIATNDTWCRDFAPISMVGKNGITMLDFIFNAWGAKFAANLDNLASKAIFRSGILQKLHNNIVFKAKNFILEGGSIDCNGDSIIITTQNCLLEANRNRMSKKKIQQKLKKYFHLKSILWLENGTLEGDDTDSHIDNLARFIDRNTIIYLQCNDKNSPNYKSLKAMEKELRAFRNMNGEKFQLVALPMPILYEKKQGKKKLLPASYVNFVFINNAILVPTFKQKSDIVALNTFKKLFPNREIIGIDSRILVKQGGSLHCLTMHIPYC